MAIALQPVTPSEDGAEPVICKWFPVYTRRFPCRTFCQDFSGNRSQAETMGGIARCHHQARHFFHWPDHRHQIFAEINPSCPGTDYLQLSQRREVSHRAAADRRCSRLNAFRIFFENRMMFMSGIAAPEVDCIIKLNNLIKIHSGASVVECKCTNHNHQRSHHHGSCIFYHN